MTCELTTMRFLLCRLLINFCWFSEFRAVESSDVLMSFRETLKLLQLLNFNPTYFDIFLCLFPFHRWEIQFKMTI